mgnify:CR=1 FL=1
MNRRGFTLMEILAVLLVLAVVASFMAPMFRYVRDEMRYQQARSAALKMADAIRSYYQNTKGYLITGSVQGDATGSNSISNLAAGTCNNPAATGIPSTTSGSTSSIAQLFACDYLLVKDFKGLPYTFSQPNNPIDDNILLVVTGGDAANRYQNKTFYVYRDMTLSAEAK